MKTKPKNLIYDVINLQIPMREECLREVESSLYIFISFFSED